MTMLDAIAAVIDPEAFDDQSPRWNMGHNRDPLLLSMLAKERKERQDAVRNVVFRQLAVLRDPGDGVTAAPSYANGEWSRRNVEAYIDAILAEAKR